MIDKAITPAALANLVGNMIDRVASQMHDLVTFTDVVELVTDRILKLANTPDTDPLVIEGELYRIDDLMAACHRAIERMRVEMNAMQKDCIALQVGVMPPGK